MIEKAAVSILPLSYASVELRHHVNSHFEKNGYAKQYVPSMQFRSQLGLVLYEGHVDLYSTFGVVKYPQTQRILQRRPEINLDFYPIKSPFFKLRQYHYWRLPFSRETSDPATRYESPWDEEADRDGTVYTVGLNPVFRHKVSTQYGIFEGKVGSDLLTRLYSRKQTVQIDGIKDQDGNEVEDYIPRIGSKQFLGLQFAAQDVPGLKLMGHIYFESRFYPNYHQKEYGTYYHYKVSRFSFYKLRLYLQLNKRLSLINDFYHFHNGFFAKNRFEHEKRFRNVMRISCLL